MLIYNIYIPQLHGNDYIDFMMSIIIEYCLLSDISFVHVADVYKILYIWCKMVCSL
jgi:hypothetical protein